MSRQNRKSRNTLKNIRVFNMMKVASQRSRKKMDFLISDVGTTGQLSGEARIESKLDPHFTSNIA